MNHVVACYQSHLHHEFNCHCLWYAGSGNSLSHIPTHAHTPTHLLGAGMRQGHHFLSGISLLLCAWSG